jgi:hypothetical protein
MYKDSIYNKITQESEDRLDLGYNYQKNGLFTRFLSPSLYGNPRIAKFLNMSDSLLIELTDSVKKIQFFYNYTIDKNDRRYNS